jgi:hypothetical protein
MLWLLHLSQLLCVGSPTNPPTPDSKEAGSHKTVWVCEGHDTGSHCGACCSFAGGTCCQQHAGAGGSVQHLPGAWCCGHNSPSSPGDCTLRHAVPGGCPNGRRRVPATAGCYCSGGRGWRVACQFGRTPSHGTVQSGRVARVFGLTEQVQRHIGKSCPWSQKQRLQPQEDHNCP